MFQGFLVDLSGFPSGEKQKGRVLSPFPFSPSVLSSCGIAEL